MLNFDEYQMSAINNLLSTQSKISVLTGGAGRGKTSILKEFINNSPGKEILCACPSGKGAKVMEVALDGTGIRSSTIHRMLGCQGPGSWVYSGGNRLEVDVVIIDEASMVGSDLMARVINGVSEEAKIILVGDAAQLPPVSPGMPFADICTKDKREVVNRLVTNYRQKEGSLIADAGDRVLSKTALLFGQPGSFTLGGEREDDLFFIEMEDKELIPAEVLGKCKAWSENKEDYQILSPQHSGVCGVENLNNYLQENLNPPSSDKPELKINNFLTLRIGDKVINKKNNYKLSIFNGYTGFVVSVHGDEVVVDFDGQIITFTEKADLRNLKLAYCLTIHSSQGSEYKNGIVICHSSHYFMWSNSLLYVAVSRFKEKLFIVGNRKGLNRGIKNDKSDGRNTYLSDVL